MIIGYLDNNQRTISTDEQRDIVNQYARDCERRWSLQEIGEKVKAHPVWIGAKIRKKGMPYKEIGQVYGIALNTVMYRLRKLENKRSCNA